MPTVKRPINEIVNESENKRLKQNDTMGDANKTNHVTLLLKMSQNRYPENATAPYIVYVFDKNPTKFLGSYHDFSLSRDFWGIKKSITKFKSLGKDKVMLYCISAQEANLLVDSKINKLNQNWSAVIPDSRVQSIGVINDVPTEIEDVSLMGRIKCQDPSVRVLKIERIKKRNPDVDMDEDGNISLIPTQMVKVFFSGLTLPKTTVIDCVERRVRHFIPKVRRCLKCLRFGHLKDQCKAKIRCPKCSEGHDVKNCRGLVVTCVNCGSSDHDSVSLICPQFKREQQIVKLKQEMGISYDEARRKVMLGSRRVNQFPERDFNDTRRDSVFSFGSQDSGDSTVTVTTVQSIVKRDDIPSGHVLFNMKSLVKTEIDKFLMVLREVSENNEGVEGLIQKAEVRYFTKFQS